MLLPLLVAAAAASPIQATGPAICSQYCSTTGCGWTDDYSCPWAPKPGRKGRAGNDNSTGYKCCCVDRSNATQACGGGRGGGAGKCAEVKGRDCVGGDISNAPTPAGVAQCCALCQLTSGCQAFTLDAFDGAGKANPTCYLKSSCPATNACGTCVAGTLGSGPPSPPAPPGPSPPPSPPSPPTSRPVLPRTPETIRAIGLVAKLTDQEKVSILSGIKSAAYGDSHNGYYIGNTPAIPRLSIPSVNMQDAAQGFRTIDKSMYGLVTSWPCSLCVASTWDVDMVEQWATALGAEFRGKGANMILGPSLNVHRVPRGGRNAEYISGEDSHLGSKLVAAYVKGVQSQKVMANIKHYILNNQETNRNGISSNVGERALQEIYMAPFRAGALAGAASAMCSYNLVNGTHSCGSDSILNKMLKTELNFTGFVVSAV